MSSSSKKFRCIIFGEEGTLAARCAELLREAGHEIVAMVTPSPQIASWANDNDVRVLAPGPHLGSELNRVNFDHLFSIANWQIIPADVLAMASGLTINYHDSLLPAYGGANATAWAIVNGERQHGISWHLMTEKIDAGNLVEQRRFDVDADETTASLNAKCYEAAVAAFAELIKKIEDGQVTDWAQSEVGRSFNSRVKVPVGDGLLDWSRSAVELESLVRAARVGNHRNPFLMTKLVVGPNVWAVRSAKALGGEEAKPGTIIEIGAASILVATGKGHLRLIQCEALDGSAEPITESIRKFGMGVGGSLPGPSAALSLALDAFVERFAKKELHWVRRLAEFEPLDLIAPAREIIQSAQEAQNSSARYTTIPVILPAGVTAFQILSVLALYLSRIAGRQSIDLMVVPENTGDQQLSPLVCDTLAVRLQVSAGQSATQALDSVNDTLTGAILNGGLLRDALIRYPDILAPNVQIPGTSFLFKLGDAVSRPNTIVCCARPGHIDFVVDTWRFDTDAVQALAGRLASFLEVATAGDRQTIEQLPLLTTSERKTVLTVWNDTDYEVLNQRPVFRQFEFNAKSQPDSVALSKNDTSLSYMQLNAWSLKLALTLKGQGVRRGSFVALLLDRDFTLPAAMIGIHQAGAAYVPLDPAHPDDRLIEILRDCEAVTIVSAGAQLDRAKLLMSALPVIDMDHLPEVIGSVDALPAPLLTDPAYLLYTSGSTGKPKGVVLSHGNLMHYVDWAMRQYPAAPTDMFALFTSIGFDLTVTSVFVPLALGGSIRIYREESPGLPPVVLDVFREDAVDVVKLTPSHLALALEMGVSLNRIHTLIVGGEDLTRALALKAYEGFGKRLIVCNEYGPTETTVGCMIHRFNPDNDLAASVPIGKPADNVSLYVLGPFGEVLPAGVVGELFIGGVGVGQGYLGRPEMTAERFLPDPFRADARMYRSGDLARWRTDGVMEYLGRKDSQVKIRGVRIEVGEVESRLLSNPQVAECVVEMRRVNVLDAELAHCTACGLPENFPGANLDATGVCAPCHNFERNRGDMEQYFRSLDELDDLFANARLKDESIQYDAMMLYSGGKDSTYALYQLVRERGLKVLAFTFDNGFIAQKAKDNIANAVADLGIELVVAKTPAIAIIYRDSLERHATVCNGCFKTIYTMGINEARKRGIRHIVTGLSRGQIFETRLAGLFASGVRDADAIEGAVLEARRLYHRQDDAVSRALDVSYVRSEKAFSEIEFVDFYRYSDASVTQIYDYINRYVPWVKPEAGGCSTNCVINDAGIFVHGKKRGFHNYAWPNSWEVRLGLKTRDEAIAELNSPIDEGQIRRILASIGYGLEKDAEPDVREMVAYYRSRNGESISGLRDWLARWLPEAMLPAHFVSLKEIPLNNNGKVDRKRLPIPGRSSRLGGSGRFPSTPTERALATIWRDLLRLDAVGVDDDFFSLGGHSLSATRTIAQLQQMLNLRLPLHIVMEHPRLGELAAVIDHLLMAREQIASTEITSQEREEGLI